MAQHKSSTVVVLVGVMIHSIRRFLVMGQSRGSGSNLSINSFSRLSWSGYVVSIIVYREHILLLSTTARAIMYIYCIMYINMLLNFKLLFNWPSALSSMK